MRVDRHSCNFLMRCQGAVSLVQLLFDLWIPPRGAHSHAGLSAWFCNDQLRLFTPHRRHQELRVSGPLTVRGLAVGEQNRDRKRAAKPMSLTHFKNSYPKGSRVNMNDMNQVVGLCLAK